MVTLNIPDNQDLIRQLNRIADEQGLPVENLIEQALEDFVARQRISRRNDPIVGIFDSGQDDIVDRSEDILSGWKPD